MGLEKVDQVAGIFDKSCWDVITVLYQVVSVEIARKDDTCGLLLILYYGCDGILYYCKDWLC